MNWYVLGGCADFGRASDCRSDALRGGRLILLPEEKVVNRIEPRWRVSRWEGSTLGSRLIGSGVTVRSLIATARFRSERMVGGAMRRRACDCPSPIGRFAMSVTPRIAIRSARRRRANDQAASPAIPVICNQGPIDDDEKRLILDELRKRTLDTDKVPPQT